MQKITKAIIPAAGFGSRRLPITKAIAKEMLPIIDRPAIDYIVEECIESGITEICIIVSRGKSMIADYFDKAPEIEYSLKECGKNHLLKHINPYEGKVRINYIRQPEMRGTAYAVGLCKEFAAGDPVALLFPDDIMYNPEYPVTKQLIDAYYEVNAPIIGVQEIPPEQAIMYGVMLPLEKNGKLTRIGGYQEKPKIEELVSNLTSLGRFILTKDIFDFIENVKPTINGEYYLASAFDDMAKVKPVYSYTFDGIRYDMGCKEGFLKANLEFAMRDATLEPYVKSLLKQ